MKLAYVLNTYPQGSHTFIRREIDALQRRGSEVLRFAMRKAPGELVDPLDVAELARTHYVLAQGWFALLRAVGRAIVTDPAAVFQTARLAWRSAWRADRGALRHFAYLAEACYLCARFHTERIDHIHAHFGTNAATVAMLASALTGVPFSFTVHGPEEFDRPEGLGLAEKMRRAAFTVAISQFGRSQLCRWVEPEVWHRIKIVHCGIEPATFADPPPLPRRRTRLVCIGRFAEQKGHLVLVEAMALLGEAVREVELSLVGDGEMRGQIENAISKHGLDAQVRITGWLGAEDVRRELASAQALVMPSFAEGLPVAVMEAMAMARPVIATYIAGIPELVRPGENGWLVPAADAGALAAVIRECAAAPLDQLEGLGRAGRARVLQWHDIDAQSARLAGFIEAVALRENVP